MFDELYRVLKEFPNNDSHWERLAGRQKLFHNGLRDYVANPSVMKYKMLDLRTFVNGPLFKNAVCKRCNGVWGGTGVDAARLVRNARVLLGTACTAAAMRAAAEKREVNADASVLKATGEVCRLIPEQSGVLHCSTIPALGDAAWHLHRIFDELGRQGIWSATARYWALYWLPEGNQQGQMESSPSIEVPTIAIGPDGDFEVSLLELLRHADGPGGWLVEHFDNALLPLAADLVSGMHAAHAASEPGAVIWRLKAPSAPRRGDSLTGAAAVGMVRLQDPEPFYPTSVAVLARVEQRNGKWVLEKVGGLNDKIDGFARAGMGINRVLAVVDPEVRWALEMSGMRIVPVQSLPDAVNRCVASTPWMMPEGQKLLGRYMTVGNPVDAVEHLQERSLTYMGEDETGGVRYLIRVFPFLSGMEEDSVARAVWDRQVRTMYRLASSRRTENSLVLMHDAGVDGAAGEGEERGAFVLVMTAPGYERLSETLAAENRQKHDEFLRKRLILAKNRRVIWEALRRIAHGIEALHAQQIVHWNVTAKNVYWDERDISSIRLGGYEKSPRYSGFAARNENPVTGSDRTVDTWSVPPERSSAPDRGLAFADDWYGFGMLAARLFYPIENLGPETPADRNRMVITQLRRDSTPLDEAEADLLLRLIALDPNVRPRTALDVISLLDRVITELSRKAVLLESNDPLVLVVDPSRSAGAATGILQKALDFGFVPDPENRTHTFYYENPIHWRNYKDFLREHFNRAQVYQRINSKDDTYALKGKFFSVLIHRHRDANEPASWRCAFASHPCEIISDLPPIELDREVLITNRQEARGYRRTRSWEDFLPRELERSALEPALTEFQNFLRCTNQIELAIRSLEVYEYEIDPIFQPATGSVRRRIRVKPTESRRLTIPGLSRKDDDLISFLEGQRDILGKCYVLLSSDSTLSWRVEEPERHRWEVVDLGPAGAILDRDESLTGGLCTPPKRGFLRMWDFHGQMKLIQRRKDAIDRLSDHTYLLKALTMTGDVYMDTRIQEFGRRDLGRIDYSKQAVIADIMRVMPLYALQGPPGTGKTTLVAHLLREILREDDVAQILVTAQAHGAVDVLRKKVAGLITEQEDILSVRLGVDAKFQRETDAEKKKELEEGTVIGEVKRVLQKAKKQLVDCTDGDPVRSEWLKLIDVLLRDMDSGAVEGTAADLVETVRRSANIVYCTTSAGDLETLCQKELSFDWAIIEEAGKVHGYDLALPMQAGHRWLLLGDQNQLYPYRIEDFEKCVNQMPAVMELLGALSGQDRYKLIDLEWRDAWDDCPDKAAFQKYVHERLKVFKVIWHYLEEGMEGRRPKGPTTEKSIGAPAGVLSIQYRMHPDIGQLVSKCFYATPVRDAPGPSDLDHGLTLPEGLRGKAVAWVDFPMTRREENQEFAEQPYYWNKLELEAIRGFVDQLEIDTEAERNLEEPLDLAILSPYNAQRHRLGKYMENVSMNREWLRFHETKRSGRAFTVDAFQGNQADIVVISLTRNNLHPPGDFLKSLGFLSRKERMNVLISRAERLLVLVGCRAFFKLQVAGVSRKATEDPLWPLARLMDMLDEYEGSGKLAVLSGIRLAEDGRRAALTDPK